MSTAAKLGAGQFGDTTYTKVFVGGLAWETHKDTMKKYFEQFGDILEAVVITDKATGRSKGYGFVTFREPEGAARACVDAAPVIDGRRANCNLASLGVQRSKPSTPKHPAPGPVKGFKVISPFLQTGRGGGGEALPAAAFPHYVQQALPYNVYGYSTYPHDYTYPTSYAYGGSQFPVYGSGVEGGGSGGGGMLSNGAAFYPLVQFGTAAYAAAMAQSYSFQYPHHHHQLFQYSSINNISAAAGPGYPPQHYGNPISSRATPTALHSGLTCIYISNSGPINNY
ncbi:unnamed protein product [Linum trigynum]|uniref:RRM domain-containing protein n=1 Tax=Linum trigynum TaxID=586398 RepID=A0AAV2C732_9ROSI